ncbi:MAG: hypothetical protein ACKOA8_07910, partial [Deltaproteobacteria bacterium]
MIQKVSHPSPTIDRSKIYFIIVLCVLSLLRLIWIGDIPYGNDDSQLFLRALSDSQQNQLTTYGLMGSRGMNYGPFAIWTYRAGLGLTRDLILFAGFRIFITTLMVSFAVYLLSILSPFLIPPIGLLALLSPYLWLYGRDLWDNSYVIPLSGIAITAYLYFSKRESAFALFLSLLMCTFGLLTHLVFIPIFLGIGLHLILFKKDWLKKHWIAGASSI